MTDTPRPLTIQKVHAILRKAGFTRSEWHRSGMVRGWGERTRGYQAEQWGPERVRVRYHFGTGVRASAADHDQILGKIRDALVAAGLAVEVQDRMVVATGPNGPG